MIFWHHRNSFKIAGRKWTLVQGVPWSSRDDAAAYDRLKIDGTLVLKQSYIAPNVECLRVRTLRFSHEGQDYHMDVGPISLWRYGIHLYRNGELIYRHRDRDFVTLPRLERFYLWLDSKGGQPDPDEPAFWKVILEALIIGAAVGVAGAIAENMLEARGVIAQGTDITPWLIGAAVAFIVLKPKRWSFIR